MLYLRIMFTLRKYTPGVTFMLDEKKIRRMTKLASYETNEGKEEIDISTYYRKDYVSINVIRTLLWVTLGYVITVALVCFAYLEVLIESITLVKIVIFAIGLVVLYIVLMFAYGIGATRHYKKKHNKARDRVKEFCHGLFLLEKMYEKENM